MDQVWLPVEGGWSVNRHTLQIIGITVNIVKNTKVTVYYADIKLAVSFNPPEADEGLIPRPLGRLKFSV